MGVTTHQFIGSSNLDTAEYDDESEDLTITFQSGDRYLYRNVPAGEFRRLQHAISAGEYFYRNIRGRYGYEQV
jgi:hypothetical protein